MSRDLRDDFEAGVHHVWARGNRRQLIFVENADRHIYLALLGKCVERAKWSCLAYCLMDNHVHLLVETERPNLSAGMQWLHGQYACGFNRRHRQVGHLFQGPFGSNRMADERQLISTIGYIALNPCAAGLCSDPSDWPWSSHAALEGGFAPPWLDVAELHRHLAPLGGDPRERYLELVAARAT